MTHMQKTTNNTAGKDGGIKKPYSTPSGIAGWCIHYGGWYGEPSGNRKFTYHIDPAILLLKIYPKCLIYLPEKATCFRRLTGFREGYETPAGMTTNPFWRRLYLLKCCISLKAFHYLLPTSNSPYLSMRIFPLYSACTRHLWDSFRGTRKKSDAFAKY